MNIQRFLQTRFSWTLFNKTLGQVLGLKHTAELLKPLKENQKLDPEFEQLGWVFKNLGRVFVLRHGPCCPNEPQYRIFKDKALILNGI